MRTGRGSDAEEPKEAVAPSAPVAAEVEPRESLRAFAEDYEAGQRIEMMGGFVAYAGEHQWTHGTRTEWIARYTEFRYREA